MLALLRQAVVEEDGARFVEMAFGSPDDLGNDFAIPEETIEFRVAIEGDGYPRMPECYEEALRIVRQCLTNELEKVKNLRGRAI